MLRALALIATLASTQVLAEPSALERAEAATQELEFDQAAKLFRSALRQPGSREERVRAHRGLGLALAYLGKSRAAQESFETLLLLQPDAQLQKSLGPKVLKPFEAARRAQRRAKPVTVEVSRDERTGAVSARLSAPVQEVSVVKLFVKPEDGEVQEETVPRKQPATVGVEPTRAAAAWAQALDEADGVLFETGSAARPLQLPATARPPAVAAAVDDARQQNLQSKPEPQLDSADRRQAPDPEPEAQVGPGARWPFWVGGAVAVVGGGVAAYFLTRPEALSLPPADRVGRLP